MNDTIRQIRTLLVRLEIDYTPEVQEALNFEYAYRLCVAFAKHLATADKKVWADMGNSSRSVYMHLARESAGIDHDDFLLHVRDGGYDVDDIYDDGGDSNARETD